MAQRSTIDLQIDNRFPSSTTKPHRVVRGQPQPWSSWNYPGRCTCYGDPGRDGAQGNVGPQGNVGAQGITGNYVVYYIII